MVIEEFFAALQVVGIMLLIGGVCLFPAISSLFNKSGDEGP